MLEFHEYTDDTYVRICYLNNVYIVLYATNNLPIFFNGQKTSEICFI